MTMSALRLTVICGVCLMVGAFLGLLLAALALASSEYLDEEKRRKETEKHD